MTKTRLLAFAAVLTLVLAACSSGGSSANSDGGSDGGEKKDAVEVSEGSTLASVLEADVVKCGTRDALEGFAVLQDDGTHKGFDNDFCRVIAAAVLGDAEKVKFVDLETDARFTALQSGEVDVLVRNTTWTASRDGVESATFLQPNFYDGQGMMVSTGSDFKSLDDMDGTTVCVASGTTTEGNVKDKFDSLGLAVKVDSFDSDDAIQEAFLAGQCDGWSGDTSGLAANRLAYPDGEGELVIFPEVFSKEPLGPAVRDGDTQWAQAVNWAVFATIQAEEFGIDSINIDDFGDTEDPSIAAFLGLESEGNPALDPGLNLPVDANYQVVKQVGNYGEIYERHIAPLGLERNQNELWNRGGLLYAPPYR